jgi:hypothetical protein
MPTRTKSMHDISRIAWQLLLLGGHRGHWRMSAHALCHPNSPFPSPISSIAICVFSLYSVAPWIVLCVRHSCGRCRCTVPLAVHRVYISGSPDIYVSGTSSLSRNCHGHHQKPLCESFLNRSHGHCRIACQTSSGRVWFGGAHPSFATLETAARPRFEHRHMMREVFVRMTIAGCKCHFLLFGSTLRIWLLSVVCPSVGWSPLGLVLIEEVLL